MRITEFAVLCLTILLFTGCASGYKMIEPKTVRYIPAGESDGVKFEFDYNLLTDKFEKKEGSLTNPV